jgi:hypothetical protein
MTRVPVCQLPKVILTDFFFILAKSLPKQKVGTIHAKHKNKHDCSTFLLNRHHTAKILTAPHNSTQNQCHHFGPSQQSLLHKLGSDGHIDIKDLSYKNIDAVQAE